MGIVMIARYGVVVQVEGAEIGRTPVTMWLSQGPPVRAWLTKRVAIVGAESTGTTTLARDLAKHYGTTWVPEYGRELTEEIVGVGTPMDKIDWSDIDFSAIAREQQRREDEAASQAGPLLICDTDALAT